MVILPVKVQRKPDEVLRMEIYAMVRHYGHRIKYDQPLKPG